MGFYYFSFFSIVPLGIAYGVLALVFWAIVRSTRGMHGRAAVLGVAGNGLPHVQTPRRLDGERYA